MQRELSRFDLGRRRVESGCVHASAEAIVVRNGVRDRRARAEQLGLDKGRLLLRAIARVKSVEIDFEFGRCLPLDRRIRLRTFEIAIFIEPARDVLRRIARQVERRRSSRTADGSIEIRPVIVGAAPRDVQQCTDLANAGVPAVGSEEPELRIELFNVGGVVPAGGDDDRRVAKLERLVQLKVGVPCNPALDEVGRRGFDDVDPQQGFGGKVLKRKGSAGGGKELAAVEGGQDVAQPADHDARDLVVRAHRHLHARHALQRRGGRRVGEFTDFLGHDRIHDLD